MLLHPQVALTIRVCTQRPAGADHPHQCPVPQLVLGAAQHHIGFTLPLHPSVPTRRPRAPPAHAGRAQQVPARGRAGCELAAAAGSLPGQCLRSGPCTKFCAPCQPHGGPTAGERFANPFIPAPCPAAQPPASFAGQCFRSTLDSSRQSCSAK